MSIVKVENFVAWAIVIIVVIIVVKTLNELRK